MGDFTTHFAVVELLARFKVYGFLTDFTSNGAHQILVYGPNNRDMALRFNTVEANTWLDGYSYAKKGATGA